MKKSLKIPFMLPVYLFLLAKSKSKVGGQAVMEGVMMRGKEHIALAVRKNESEVVVERQPFSSVCKRYTILGKPVFRGAVSLFESLIIGYKTLTRSAEILEDEQRKVALEEGKKIKERNKTGEKILTGFSLMLSLVITFGVFMYLPMWLFSHVVSKDSALLFNMGSGGLRIIFFLLYLIAISMWNDIRRLFEYHGAEHKAIFTFEDGKELTLENMRPYTTLHPRCGTSFLFLVGFICILLFSIVDALYIMKFGPYPSTIVRFAVHFLLVPLVSGTSYEVLKLSDTYSHLPVVGFLIQPGLLLQKITTKNPDDSQLDVAAQALKAAL